MEIRPVSRNSNSRLWFNDIQDERNGSWGFKKETGWKDWIYKRIGLAFSDPSVQNGSINKRSAILYLRRNRTKFNPTIAAQIDRLNLLTSRADRVKALFEQIKAENPIIQNFLPQELQPSIPPQPGTTEPDVLPQVLHDPSKEVSGPYISLSKFGPEDQLGTKDKKEENYVEEMEKFITTPKYSLAQLQRSLALSLDEYDMKKIDPDGVLYRKALSTYIENPVLDNKEKVRFFAQNAIDLKQIDPDGGMLLEALRAYIQKPSSDRRQMAEFFVKHSIDLKQVDPKGVILLEALRAYIDASGNPMMRSMASFISDKSISLNEADPNDSILKEAELIDQNYYRKVVTSFIKELMKK